jgi:hypothetical protein
MCFQLPERCAPFKYKKMVSVTALSALVPRVFRDKTYLRITKNPERTNAKTVLNEAFSPFISRPK